MPTLRANSCHLYEVLCRIWGSLEDDAFAEKYFRRSGRELHCTLDIGDKTALDRFVSDEILPLPSHFTDAEVRGIGISLATFVEGHDRGVASAVAAMGSAVEAAHSIFGAEDAPDLFRSILRVGFPGLPAVDHKYIEGEICSVPRTYRPLT